VSNSLVCVFRVLKAGGVYVPLDPQASADRIGYIIGNCGIRVLLRIPALVSLAAAHATQTS